MAKNMIPVSQGENKPKRRTNNPTGKGLPSTRGGFGQSEEDRSLISQLLSEGMEAYSMPRVQDDTELAQRFQDYFADRAERGILPSIEEMYLYTGYSIRTVQEWESGKNRGFSDSTARIVEKAKDFIKNFDGKLVMTGKLNFLAYCFRAKNYYGMSDKTEISVTPTAPTVEYNKEDIINRYLEDGSVVDQASDSSDSE